MLSDVDGQVVRQKGRKVIWKIYSHVAKTQEYFVMISVFFFKLSLTITLINNYTIYKSIKYSTYITYNPIWNFYTEQEKRERKTTYNTFSKELIEDKTKIIQKIV